MKTSHSLLTVLLLLSNAPLHAAEPGLSAILPAKLEDASGNEVDPVSLKGKTVGLYFSGSFRG